MAAAADNQHTCYWASWCVACWWWLGEIELAAILLSPNCIQCGQSEDGTATAAIRLGGSNTDIVGKDPLRTLVCMCNVGNLAGSGGVQARLVFGVCCLKAEVAVRCSNIGVRFADCKCFSKPLFCNGNVIHLSKCTVFNGWSLLQDVGSTKAASRQSPRKSGA